VKAEERSRRHLLQASSTITADLTLPLVALDSVSMSSREQQDLVLVPTYDKVEVVEHIATENAEIGCRWIRERCEVASHAHYLAVISGELDFRRDQHKVGRSADPHQAISLARYSGRDAQAEAGDPAEYGLVRTRVDQKPLGQRLALRSE
jgi:hypothetical protein